MIEQSVFSRVSRLLGGLPQAILLLCMVVLVGFPTLAFSQSFRRGDVNDDGKVSFFDPCLILDAVFGAGFLPCEDAADVDDNGIIDLSDAVFLLVASFPNGRVDDCI